MAQIGDTVRFLNTTGGGKITRIEGKIAYVEEDGFETPVLLKEIVVVLPAGHEPKKGGANLMFDQTAFDNGKKDVRPTEKLSKETTPANEPEELPVEETAFGEEMNIVMIFEPENIKDITKSKFNVALVNDSNYFLFFNVMIRDFEAKAWKSLYISEVAPNEIIDIANFTHDNLSDFERFVFQAVAYKKGKSYQVKYPLNVSKKLDLTKFFKPHCFRPGVFTDSPAMEVTLYSERR